MSAPSLVPEHMHLPTPPDDFLGRNVDMYQVIGEVLRRRLVTISGLAGIGKTALSIAACNYLAERRYRLRNRLYIA